MAALVTRVICACSPHLMSRKHFLSITCSDRPSSVSLQPSDANMTDSYGLRYVYQTKENIINIGIKWALWPDLSTCNTSQDAVEQGIHCVCRRMRDMITHKGFALSSVEIVDGCARVTDACGQAQQNLTARDAGSWSPSQHFRVGALATLQEMDLSFPGNRRLTKRLKKVRECLEKGVQDEFIRFRHFEVKQNMIVTQAQQELAGLQILKRTIWMIQVEV
jgi:hypothetical protein